MAGKNNSLNPIPKLRIGNLVAEIPIIQGGMGIGVSLSRLAAAVANEGGIGVISAVMLGLLNRGSGSRAKLSNVEALRQEIRKARQQTRGIIGVNILKDVTDFDSLLKCAVEEEVDLCIVGAGLPLQVPAIVGPENMASLKTKFAPIVSSAQAARLILKYWSSHYNCLPDAIIVEGPLAGGHLGFKKEQITDPEHTLEKILPQVIAEVKLFEEKFDKRIPTIAAGGIYTGADIRKFIQMGAEGVQMGTRFVATHECDVSDEFKQLYIDCRQEDMVIIESPLGLPGRAISNTFLKEVTEGKKVPTKCPWKCLRSCNYTLRPTASAWRWRTLRKAT